MSSIKCDRCWHLD